MDRLVEDLCPFSECFWVTSHCLCINAQTHALDVMGAINKAFEYPFDPSAIMPDIFARRLKEWALGRRQCVWLLFVGDVSAPSARRRRAMICRVGASRVILKGHFANAEVERLR